MLDYSVEAANFRADIKNFLDKNLPSGWGGMGGFTSDERREFVANWRRTLSQHQLLAVAWPVEYGGAGLSQMERTVLAEELAEEEAPVDGTAEERIAALEERVAELTELIRELTEALQPN